MENACKPQLLKIRGKKIRVQGQHGIRQQDHPRPYQKAVVYIYSTEDATLSTRETSKSSLVLQSTSKVQVKSEVKYCHSANLRSTMNNLPHPGHHC